MQKRLISMVLALSMALTAMPLPALAQSVPPDTASAAALAEENGDVTDIYSIQTTTLASPTAISSATATAVGPTMRPAIRSLW